jgi:hypothetical protein
MTEYTVMRYTAMSYRVSFDIYIYIYIYIYENILVNNCPPCLDSIIFLNRLLISSFKTDNIDFVTYELILFCLVLFFEFS